MVGGGSGLRLEVESGTSWVPVHKRKAGLCKQDQTCFDILRVPFTQMGWDPLRLGSVAKWMLGHKQDVPIALVRKAQIPAAKDAAKGANVLIAVDNTPVSVHPLSTGIRLVNHTIMAAGTPIESTSVVIA